MIKLRISLGGARQAFVQPLSSTRPRQCGRANHTQRREYDAKESNGADHPILRYENLETLDHSVRHDALAWAETEFVPVLSTFANWQGQDLSTHIMETHLALVSKWKKFQANFAFDINWSNWQRCNEDSCVGSASSSFGLDALASAYKGLQVGCWNLGCSSPKAARRRRTSEPVTTWPDWLPPCSSLVPSNLRHLSGKQMGIWGIGMCMVSLAILAKQLGSQRLEMTVHATIFSCAVLALQVDAFELRELAGSVTAPPPPYPVAWLKDL